MSATGAAVPPAFQRVKPRTVLGARSASVGAPSPCARRTVSTCVGESAAIGGGASASSSCPPERTPSKRSCSSRSAASCAVGSSCAMRPLTITPMRSATVIATPRFCSISSTEISPSAARSRSACATCSTITGARPSVGSSITSSFGFSSSARPIASICCSPPESCAPPLPLRSASRGNIEYTRSTSRFLLATSRSVSSTESEGHTRRPWGTYAMPRRVISFGARPRISSPSRRTLPRAGTRPVIALHSVVLPMPLRPTMPSTP